MAYNLTTLVSSFLCLFLGFTAAQITYECPRSWLENHDVCYHFVQKPLTVQHASLYCQEKDHSSLLTVASETEHDFIRTTILSYNLTHQVPLKDRSFKSESSDWLTSGVRRGDKIVWDTDDSEITQLFFPTDEVKNTNYIDPVTEIKYNRIVYRYNAVDQMYYWAWGRIMKASPFICKMKKADTWKFYQQQRNFSFGTDVEDPTQWPLGPQFHRQPNNTVFYKIEGSQKKTIYTPLTLECDALGNPQPTYKWYRSLPNGQRVQITSNKQHTITNGVLHIQSPKTDTDVSKYSCEAENKHGKIISDEVEVSYGYVGEFPNVQTNNYRGVQYQGLEMDCKPPSYKPAARINWFRQDTQHFIRSSYNPQYFVSKNGKLYISEVTPDVARNFYCQVTLIARSGEKLARLQPPISVSRSIGLSIEGENANTYGPDIQDKFPQYFPKPPQVGQRMEIECFAYGRLPLKYRWEREDGEMNPEHRLDDHGRRLIIDNPRLEDTGRYACIVTGNRDTDRRVINVQMAQSPTFTYPLKDQHPDIGSEFTWTCNAIAVPTPTYKWYKDGQVLKNDNDLGITVKRNRLHFDKIDAKKHNGMYQCLASVDNLNWHQTSAQLAAVEFAPTFAKNPLPKSFVASINGEITIKCQPEAAPRPDITWTHNDRSLGGNAHILPSGSLVLTGLTESDAGTYKCTATNRLGDSSSSTELTIVDQTVLTEKPSDEDVQQNGTVALTCKASFDQKATDAIYAWKFNDHQLDLSRDNAYSMPNTASQDGVLYIAAAQFQHEGEYTCEVITKTNVVKASAYLRVLGPPSEPAGVHVRQAKGLEVELWWNVPGDDHGGMVSKYTIEAQTEDGSFLVAKDIKDESAKISTYRGWRSHMIKTGLSPGAGFRFRVRAANEYGYGAYSRPSVLFKIDDAPPIHSPTGIRAANGSESTLSITWELLPKSQWGSSSVSYNVFLRRTNAYEIWQGFKKLKFRDGDEIRFDHTINKEFYYTPYDIMVQAENHLGPGPNSSLTVVYSNERMPQLAPTNVVVNAINATAGTVTWNPVPNTRKAMGGTILAYQVNYWEEPSTICPPDKEDTFKFVRFYGNTSEGLIIGITPGGYACVTVQFMNHAGLGPKTDPYSMGLNYQAPVDYPHFVTITSHGTESVRVTWQGVLTTQDEESVIGYKAWVWSTKEEMRAAKEIDFGNVYSGVIHDIEKNNLYKLRILSYSNGGDGKKSPDMYFTLGGMVLIDIEKTELMNTAPPVAWNFPVIILSTMMIYVLCWYQ